MTKLVISNSYVNWERTQFPNLRTLKLEDNVKGNGFDKNKAYFWNLKVLARLMLHNQTGKVHSIIFVKVKHFDLVGC